MKNRTGSINIKEIARLFLRLGFTAFGGPAVHIAMMRKETVDKLNWFSNEYFTDLIGASSLVPGPTSTELAILIGKLRAERIDSCRIMFYTSSSNNYRHYCMAL